jgi:putative SOS response-associated peptidase YedK
MCGRYVLYGPTTRLEEHFEVNWPEFTDRYNIAPTSQVPVIRQSPEGQRVAHLLKWGLIPHWSKDPTIGAKLNNARAETVADKPSFRSAYRKRRCLIPAQGYYEWQEVPGEKKQPWYIRLKADEPMAMGGLWESWTAPDGDIVRSFCVVTTSPNAVMQPIHDRMPVIIGKGDWQRWLNPAESDVGNLLDPFDADAMQAWKVSRQVSRAAEEGPELIMAINS